MESYVNLAWGNMPLSRRTASAGGSRSLSALAACSIREKVDLNSASWGLECIGSGTLTAIRGARKRKGDRAGQRSPQGNLRPSREAAPSCCRLASANRRAADTRSPPRVGCNERIVRLRPVRIERQVRLIRGWVARRRGSERHRTHAQVLEALPHDALGDEGHVVLLGREGVTEDAGEEVAVERDLLPRGLWSAPG
jgi:hypothetical protein